MARGGDGGNLGETRSGRYGEGSNRERGESGCELSRGLLDFQVGGHAADDQLLSVRCPISRTVRLVEAAIVRKRKLD